MCSLIVHREKIRMNDTFRNRNKKKLFVQHRIMYIQWPRHIFSSKEFLMDEWLLRLFWLQFSSLYTYIYLYHQRQLIFNLKSVFDYVYTVDGQWLSMSNPIQQGRQYSTLKLLYLPIRYFVCIWIADIESICSSNSSRNNSNDTNDNRKQRRIWMRKECDPFNLSHLFGFDLICVFYYPTWVHYTQSVIYCV